MSSVNAVQGFSNPTFPARTIAGLYLLTRETADTDALIAGVAAAINGGARVVQYRDKSHDPLRRRQQASELAALCRRHHVVLIINDDVELALIVDAAGVHLGEHDGSVADARLRLGPDRIIGVSCYDQLAAAERAVAEGADYVAFGAFFPSNTKPLARRAAPEVLRDARRQPVPAVAIGGIDASNAAFLIESGASAVAVLGAVWDAPDMGAAAQAISSLFSNVGDRS